MKIIVTAGGTGGHIYPALAIINKFKELDKALEVIYVGTTNRMEKDIIPPLNIKYIPIEIYGLTSNIKNDLKDLLLIPKAIKKMVKLMQEFKPDFVLGIGGYVTYPVIKAAYKLHIPIFIHEQNAIPGKVNKATSKYATLIGVSIPSTTKYFDSKKVFYSGNPTGERALTLPKISRKELGFSEGKKLIVIVAGSLGSSSLSNVFDDYLQDIDDNVQVLYITGKGLYDRYKDKKYPSNVLIKPFFNDLPRILKSADLLISRAGASTISEIEAIKIPTIFIPSPYVANNHQYYNALELTNMGAALMIEEKDLTKDVLKNKINSILNNQEEINKIKANLNKINTLDSSLIIYNKIKETLNE